MNSYTQFVKPLMFVRLADNFCVGCIVISTKISVIN